MGDDSRFSIAKEITLAILAKREMVAYMPRGEQSTPDQDGINAGKIYKAVLKEVTEAD